MNDFLLIKALTTSHMNSAGINLFVLNVKIIVTIGGISDNHAIDTPP